MSVKSIQAKLTLGLVAIAILTISLSYWNTAVEERALAEELVETNLWHTADNYFDSINSFMLTGMMDKRQILQDKMLKREDIVEARVIRSDKTKSLYGAGHTDQAAVDEFDRTALTGKRQSFFTDTADGRTFTVIEPLIARTDYKGTNCLGCHMAQDGDVLGALRLTASLKSIDKRIDKSVTQSVLIQLLVLTVAFAVLLWFIHTLVISRLKGLRNSLTKVARDMDLTSSFRSESSDEVGDLSNAVDTTLHSFREHLVEVNQSAAELLGVAQDLKRVAKQTDDAVSEQKLQTDSVASALTEMEATSVDVKQRTVEAQEKSASTDKLSEDGIHVAEQAQNSIFVLSQHISEAAAVIDQLDARIQSVTLVLDVIGGIAEQTNLLALNAAIEAARAGEQGRGFAVVADEVRSLAKRTHDSTDEIKTTITALQAEAVRAVDSMNRSTEEAAQRADSVKTVTQTLQRIAEHVGEIAELNTQIAMAADQQSETASEIQHNTIKIRDIAHQSEEVADRAMHNSQQLLEMAEQLQQHVAKFKL
ncbi:methyl-accepting chemotaxis protein [Alteromonas lipolytica]|uniref:Chemotaxis protein n=1 Tax=Alteromonas lipolytica TaxID=1856405 RepID=A0A1E8FI12_9ALTE|nr:methyl-accepting chemotaxis protein [Alteromonas lipolytica]OFI35575.1 hypothetical protein BFC17_12505 [Alteromonas lipolytica]GGF77310.1 methyl-accepting chemotaxis protein [Alteromonas lipolytica]